MRAWTNMSIIGHLGKTHHGTYGREMISINHTALDVFGNIDKDEAPLGRPRLPPPPTRKRAEQVGAVSSGRR
jgi:hypothetical protein